MINSFDSFGVPNSEFDESQFIFLEITTSTRQCTAKKPNKSRKLCFIHTQQGDDKAFSLTQLDKYSF